MGAFFKLTFDFLLSDRVRLVELFSTLNLLAWAYVLYSEPELLTRPTYQTFQSLSATTWIVVFVIAAVLQIAGLFSWHRKVADIRFIAMAIATGCWAAITVNFFVGTVPTTATANYALLTFVTAISGGFLGWKTSYPVS